MNESISKAVYDRHMVKKLKMDMYIKRVLVCQFIL